MKFFSNDVYNINKVMMVVILGCGLVSNVSHGAAAAGEQAQAMVDTHMAGAVGSIGEIRVAAGNLSGETLVKTEVVNSASDRLRAVVANFLNADKSEGAEIASDKHVAAVTELISALAADAARPAGRVSSDVSGSEGMEGDCGDCSDRDMEDARAVHAGGKRARSASDAIGNKKILDPEVMRLMSAIDCADAQTVGGIILMNFDYLNRELEDGETPLLHAVFKGRTNVARVLLDLNADPNVVRERDGVTPLLVACAQGQPSMIRLLLECKASVQVQDKEGGVPLLHLYGHENPAVFKLLIDAQADVDHRTKTDKTILMSACCHADEPLVRMLVGAGAKVDASACNGITPLKSAVLGENLNIVKFLLESKVDANQNSLGGDTALILATISENVAIVRALLGAKANPTLRNGHHRDAMYYATHPEIHGMLEVALRSWSKQDGAGVVHEVLEHKE